ncbi:MAG: glycerol-3-phosphate dehydrogenase/oxidase [Anaerolineae bacterium]|nr:glycerol-3-phosphate dehydrogenase/oxidase [Anaerolineae bacterium]
MTDAIPTSPWPPGWREAALASLPGPWDVIVIGGGITGAGILALAARMGLRALLLEQADFGSGTSSRSSKLVHGGLRYLKQMQFRLTHESVREREYLLAAAPGLIRSLPFLYPIYKGDRPGARVIEFGLSLYTHMAPTAGGYRTLDPVDLLMLAPGLRQGGLERGYLYTDAQTDDARLVLRVLADALRASEGRCLALNYAAVVGLLRSGDRVRGVQVRDEETGRGWEVEAGVVINATGAWADRLRPTPDKRRHLRPLRGSHLFFRPERFPVYQAIALIHPDDHRPLFVYPWEGVILLGTTDCDHRLPLEEPGITAAEADYLLRAAQTYFPDLELGPADVLSTQAGVRPVVDTGKANPSAERREHVIWIEDGLLTVTGGKLTTFRLIALDALTAAHELNPDLPQPRGDLPVFEPTPVSLLPGCDRQRSARLWGRYGAAASEVVNAGSLALIPDTPYHEAELIWAARHEAVVHLDDLLLRRLRLGILRADGGLGLLPRVRDLLPWDTPRWQAEVSRFEAIHRRSHGLPEGWGRKEGAEGV